MIKSHSDLFPNSHSSHVIRPLTCRWMLNMESGFDHVESGRDFVRTEGMKYHFYWQKLRRLKVRNHAQWLNGNWHVCMMTDIEGIKWLRCVDLLLYKICSSVTHSCVRSEIKSLETVASLGRTRIIMKSAVWLLMAWCFRTRASAATMLTNTFSWLQDFPAF